MPVREPRYPCEFDVVVVGGSLGALKPLGRILSNLPRFFPAPIVIALHRSERVPDFRPQLFGNSSLELRTARNEEWLNAGCAYFSPPGAHISVLPPHRCQLQFGPRIGLFRPSIDHLFESAAASFGPRAMAVILSGRLNDGARGALAIRNNGGVVFAQSPQSCEAASMPKAAIENGSATFSLDPLTLSRALVSLAMVPGSRWLFGASSTVA